MLLGSHDSMHLAQGLVHCKCPEMVASRGTGFFPKSEETFRKSLPAHFFLQFIGQNWVMCSLLNQWLARQMEFL